MTIIIVFVSASLACIRVTGHKGNVYKDTAHQWVGWLAGMWTIRGGPVEWWAFWALCVVEVACAAWFYLHSPVHIQASLHPEQWRTTRRP